MKHILITIAAVLLVGCGPQPPDISIHDAVEKGNIEVVKLHLAAGTDVNAKECVIALRTIGSQIGSHWQQFIRLFAGIGLLTGSQAVVSSNPPR